MKRDFEYSKSTDEIENESTNPKRQRRAQLMNYIELLRRARH